MRPTDKRYVRLPGSRRGWFTGSSLWIGSDHLLSVRRLVFSEQYRRYYFNDIQAITVQHDPSKSTFAVDSVVAGIAVVLHAVLLATGHLAFIPLAAIIAFGYLLFRARRPNCSTYIQTAANTDLLPALFRIRSTRKALARIEPLIREAQGRIPEVAEPPAVAHTVVDLPPPLPELLSPAPPPLPPLPEVLPPPLPVAPAVIQPLGLYLTGFAVTAGVGVAKIASAYIRLPILNYLLPVGYVVSVAVFLIPLFKGLLSHLQWRQLAPVLTVMIFAGLTGVYSVSFAVQRASSTQTEPKIEQFYRWFDSVRAFAVTPGALLFVFGIWGLWAFVAASSDDPQPDSLALSLVDRS